MFLSPIGVALVRGIFAGALLQQKGDFNNETKHSYQYRKPKFLL